MKTTIASILSAMAAMAVVSGFILPNNQGSNSMIGGVHRQKQLQQKQFERISSENLLSTTTRLLMSETSTRTFERREGGGPSSYGGRGGGRGRGGKLGCFIGCTVHPFDGYFCCFRISCLALRHHAYTCVDCSIADPFALLGTEYYSVGKRIRSS